MLQVTIVWRLMPYLYSSPEGAEYTSHGRKPVRIIVEFNVPPGIFIERFISWHVTDAPGVWLLNSGDTANRQYTSEFLFRPFRAGYLNFLSSHRASKASPCVDVYRLFRAQYIFFFFMRKDSTTSPGFPPALLPSLRHPISFCAQTQQPRAWRC